MSTSETLDYAPNYAHVIEIDITPEKAEPTWAWAQVGILECKPESDEKTSEDAYFHLLGSTETNIDSVKVSIAISGHRMYGDPCQDFVAGRALGTGKDRKTRYRWTMPDGTILAGECTLSGLVPGSAIGAANDKGEFSYKINLDTIDKQNGSGGSVLPNDVTCTAVTVQVGKSSPAGATVTPQEANQKCHYAIADTSIATVNQNGVIAGVAAGETMLTVKAASKPSIYAQTKITVSGSAPASAPASK